MSDYHREGPRIHLREDEDSQRTRCGREAWRIASVADADAFTKSIHRCSQCEAAHHRVAPMAASGDPRAAARRLLGNRYVAGMLDGTNAPPPHMRRLRSLLEDAVVVARAVLGESDARQGGS